MSKHKPIIFIIDGNDFLYTPTHHTFPKNKFKGIDTGHVLLSLVPQHKCELLIHLGNHKIALTVGLN